MRATSALTNAERFSKFSGHAPPRFRAACGGRPEPPDATRAGQRLWSRRMQRGTAPRRSDIPPLPPGISLSRTVIAPALWRSRPTNSHPQESAPATCESNRRTRHALDPGCRPNGARSEARQTAHRNAERVAVPCLSRKHLRDQDAFYRSRHIGRAGASSSGGGRPPGVS